MTSINEMELQTIRHLIMANDTLSCKMADYAQEAQTPEDQTVFSRKLPKPPQRPKQNY